MWRKSEEVSQKKNKKWNNKIKATMKFIVPFFELFQLYKKTPKSLKSKLRGKAVK